MKVVIVNCFDTYEERIDLLHDFFINKEYDVTIIQSNFRHVKKVKRTESKQHFIFVESKPYYKNMSVARITSHYDFAKRVFKVVEYLQPDILYVMVPPNSLTKFAIQYKRKHNNVRLIFDLIDLWPETMPVGKVKKLVPFRFWQSMRDKSLKHADLVITECNLYQGVLVDVLKGVKTETVYLAKKKIDVISKPMLSEKEIHLAYLGSINNIIDIPKIKEIIQAFGEFRPVTLHIIGDGESKQELIDEAESGGANVEYYGKIYDPQEKQNIFDKCHFGINIMKKNVCVGLTMKSIDYFQHGIPIINNIPADTAEIVEKYGVGVNVFNKENSNISSLFKKDVWLSARHQCYIVYNTMFSYEAFCEGINSKINV